jgi:hypothetical protein
VLCICLFVLGQIYCIQVHCIVCHHRALRICLLDLWQIYCIQVQHNVYSFVASCIALTMYHVLHYSMNFNSILTH